jgi:hypothetical protein
VLARREVADALALVLEGTGREQEVGLPTAVLAVVLAGEFVVVQRPVHVGIVDLDSLAAKPARPRAIIGNEEDVRDLGTTSALRRSAAAQGILANASPKRRFYEGKPS